MSDVDPDYHGFILVDYPKMSVINQMIDPAKLQVDFESDVGETLRTPSAEHLAKYANGVHASRDVAGGLDSVVQESLVFGKNNKYKPSLSRLSRCVF